MNLVAGRKTTLPAHLADVAAKAQQLIRQRHAEATRRAYAADVQAFKDWCDAQQVEALPASSEVVCLFLAAQAEAGKSASTIVDVLMFNPLEEVRAYINENYELI